jgi:hypothetical protein
MAFREVSVNEDRKTVRRYVEAAQAALLGGGECCLLAGRFVRQIGQYLVPALFGEHVAGVGTDACGVVGVEVEDADCAVSADGVQAALRIERDAGS